MENFGANLKMFRLEKGLSQDILAQRIGVHVTNLSKYEREKSIPSLEIADKIAEELEISLDELVYGLKNKKARTQLVDDELLKMFNKTQKLSSTQKNTVLELLSAFILKADLKKQIT